MATGEEKVACSKKCKKVSKFAWILKKATEAEVLREFEAMLRRKATGKRTKNNHPGA